MRPADPPTENYTTLRVADVKPGSVVENFDIEVETDHEFYASGLCVHNCGNYHPHGDASMSGTIARMTQFRSSAPLVVGIGNFGWHDAPPAAPRYTSCHLSPYALSMMDASELTQVPMDRSYDGKNEEPRHLPVRLPHLLVGGCKGIAAGYSADVPPCDPAWVVGALESTVRGERVAAPDRFAHRWGGELLRLDESWVDSGNGSASFAPTIVEDGNRVLVTSLAPGLDVRAIVRIMTACPDLASVTEETPQSGERVRLVCTLRRGGDAKVLFAHALDRLVGRAQNYSFLHIHQFDTSMGVDYNPVEEGPRQYLRRWLHWRTRIVSGAARHRADEHRRAIAWQEIVLRAIAAQRRLSSALEQSRDKPDLVQRVRKILRCVEPDAVRVVELQFYRLAHANVDGIHEQIAAHAESARREDAVAAAPTDTLLANAHMALESLRDSTTSSAPKPKSRRKKRS